MAERCTLLARNKASSSSYVKRKYRYSCIRSKGVLIVLLWGLLMTTVIVITGALSNVFISDFSYIIFAVIGLYYLFYPLLGLLGEKWMRYRVMIIGSIIICFGFITVLISLLFVYMKSVQSTQAVIIALVVSCPYFLGQGIFGANVIQFGTDQLQFAPSEELSSFVYWFLYLYYFPLGLILLMSSAVNSLAYNHTKYYVASVVFGCGSVIIVVALFSACCFKRHLVIEPSQNNNPVKLILKVMRYAWIHKQPVRRSAFTYGEPPPSRLDLGKQRYGGPFTTVQVEDVKTFLYILSILLGTFGYGLLDTTKASLSHKYMSVAQRNGRYSFMESILLIYPLTIPYCVVSVAVLIHQFIIVPYFSRYIPSMLKRIWIGLVAMLLQLVITVVISFMMSYDIKNTLINGTTSAGFVYNICLDLDRNNTILESDNFTLPYYVMALPQFITGISIFLVHFTSFEFILAQGPRSMQGLLIGVWFMHLSIYSMQLTLSSSSLSCYCEYYLVTMSLVLISIIAYTIAAYKYKYRQRNELSDVNERIIITQYTERQLDREDRKSEDEFSFCIVSNENNHNKSEDLFIINTAS